MINRNFINLLSGFLGIILAGIGVILAVGFYEFEILGRPDNGEIASPPANGGSIGSVSSGFEDRFYAPGADLKPKIPSFDWKPEYPPRPE